jgi:3D (Asp-Asp-Asp) domain-containing protein
MKLADGAIYLRTTMPSEFFAEATPVDVDDEAAESENIEQRLVDMLYQDDQDAVYNVVKNDERWRVVRMRVTAYCPCSKCCGNFSDGITACNHRIRPGDVFVAADKAFRFRTGMIVPGYNGNQPVQVLDRGRLIKGNRLDVFFSSHSVAKKWGTRTLDVLVREN